MKKRLFIILIPILVVILVAGIVYGAWRIENETPSNPDANVNNVEQYEIVDYKKYIDLTSNKSYYQTAGSNQNILKYYDTGFLDITSSTVQNNEAIIRCYYSLIPNKIGVNNSTFNIKFTLNEEDNLNLLSGTTISSKVVQQTSVNGYDEKATSSNTVVAYPNISSNYSVRLYMYVEYVISNINFTTFKNNVGNVQFGLTVEVENDTRQVWKMLYHETLLPQKDNLTYLAKNLDGKEKAYSGSTVNVFKDSTNTLWSFLGVSESTLSNSYVIKVLDTLTGNYSTTLPSNAGTYTFQILYKNNATESKTFDFTIKGTKIYAGSDSSVEYHIIELGYNECAIKTWGSDFEEYIKGKLSFITESGTSALTLSSEYSISAMTDLSFTYTHSGSNYTISRPSEFASTYNSVVGSTYYVNLKINNGGYTLANKIILKYKTAYCNSAYYTIEDAISQNKQTTMAGNQSNTEYRTTAFSKYIKQNGLTSIYNNDCYNVRSNLIVPYTDLGGVVSSNTGGYPGYNDSQKSPGYSASKVIVSSCLYLPENVILSINSNVYVTAFIDTTSGSANEFLVQQHGVIMNKGIMNFENGSNLYSYGFTKGVYNENSNTGLINLKSGSNAYDVMSMYDWGGGSAANTLNNNKVFVINTWMINNISCYTKYFKGSSLTCTTGVYIPSLSYGYMQTQAIIINSTNSSSAKCLFMPSTNATNSDYIVKYGKESKTASYNPNNSVSIGNQDLNQKSVIELHGKYVDSNFSVSLTALVVTVSMTAKDFTIPISNFDFLIASNSSVVFSYLKLAMMCGTKMIIEENATINFTSGSFIAADKLNGSDPTICPGFKSYCKNLVDAEIINNGRIIATSSYLGGKILVSQEGAIVSGNQAIPTIKLKSSGENYTTTSNYYAFGNQISNNHIVSSNLTNNYYESELGYGLLDTQPSDWSSNYSSYFKKSGNEYVALTSAETFASNTYYYCDYYWNYINNVSMYSHTIKFYDGSVNVYTMEIPSTDANYIFNGNEYSISKDYNSFDGWVTSNGGSNSAIGSTVAANSTLSVYAKWLPNTYTISYTPILGTSLIDLSDTNLTGEENLITSFQFDGTNFRYGDNYSLSGTSLSVPAINYVYHDKNCVFEGWDIYIEIFDNVYSQNIGTSLSANGFKTLESAASNYGIELSNFSIPLVCRFYDFDALTITYDVSGFGSYASPSNQSGVGNFSITTSSIPNYVDNINTENKYLAGWKNEGLSLYVNIGDTINVTISAGIYYVNGHSLGLGVTTLNLVANWQPKLVLTIDYQDGSVSNVTQYYLEGQAIVYPTTPSVSGKAFVGWYNEPGCTTPFDGIMPSSSKTIYAKWEQSYDLTLNYNGHGGTNTTNGYSAGQSVSLPTLSATGWIFGGWYTDSGFSTSASNPYVMPAENKTLYAKWTQVTFTITIKAGSNGSVSATSIPNVPYGSTVTVNSNKITIAGTTVTATANSNYSFDKWDISNGATLTEAKTITATFKSSGSCLLPNTLVTMADGTLREIQYLVPGDMVVVFNHETGMLDIAPVTFNEYEEAQWCNVIHLIFDNGSDIGVISEHGFFDLDTMKYEYIDEDNYLDFIGHRFYTIDGTSTVLTDAYVTSEYTMCYSLPTYYHLNLFTEGILSMPGGITGLFNYFDYADNLQYDQDKMIEDINTYGLFTVEEFEPYGVTEEMFNAYAGKYLKVALGKGILTEEYLMYLVERYGKYTE